MTNFRFYDLRALITGVTRSFAPLRMTTFIMTNFRFYGLIALITAQLWQLVNILPGVIICHGDKVTRQPGSCEGCHYISWRRMEQRCGTLAAARAATTFRGGEWNMGMECQVISSISGLSYPTSRRQCAGHRVTRPRCLPSRNDRNR